MNKKILTCSLANKKNKRELGNRGLVKKNTTNFRGVRNYKNAELLKSFQN